jgi:hypothetical protein
LILFIKIIKILKKDRVAYVNSPGEENPPSDLIQVKNIYEWWIWIFMAVSRWSKIQLQPNLLISLFSGLNFKLYIYIYIYIYIMQSNLFFFFFMKLVVIFLKGKLTWAFTVWFFFLQLLFLHIIFFILNFNG